MLRLRVLLTGADRDGVADDIRLDTLQLHLAQQLQALLELRALLAGAARRAVADDIRLGTLPLKLAQQPIPRSSSKACSGGAFFSQALIAAV